jgi:RHS repeat-associated protein
MIVDQLNAINYEVNNLNGYIKVGEYEIKYDANGNMINDGVNRFNYNAENKLIQLNDCLLKYDHFNNLNEIICSQVSSKFINDPFGVNGVDIIKELRSDGNNISYLNAFTQNIFGFELKNQNYFFLFDNDFNVLNIVNKNKLINSYEYDPFGVITQSNEKVFNRLKYSGQIGIFELPYESYQIRARVYKPNLGKFTSLDPSAEKAVNNRSFLLFMLYII